MVPTLGALVVQLQLQLVVEIEEIDKELPTRPLRIVELKAINLCSVVRAIFWDDLDANSVRVGRLP